MREKCKCWGSGRVAQMNKHISCQEKHLFFVWFKSLLHFGVEKLCIYFQLLTLRNTESKLNDIAVPSVSSEMKNSDTWNGLSTDIYLQWQSEKETTYKSSGAHLKETVEKNNNNGIADTVSHNVLAYKHTNIRENNEKIVLIVHNTNEYRVVKYVIHSFQSIYTQFEECDYVQAFKSHTSR